MNTASALSESATLEAKIDVAYMGLQFGKTPAQRRKAAAEMRRLIAQRSDDRVAQMERERGFR